MPKIQITLNKEWLDGLVEIVDNLEKGLPDNNRQLAAFVSGYVHALDNQFKEE